MNDEQFINRITDNSLNGKEVTKDEALQLLTDKNIDLIDLIHGAYRVRKKICGKSVKIHILNNVQNGKCPEDCRYCVQGKSGTGEGIIEYEMKSEEQIMEEAEMAYKSGAFRYCMVFSGRGPSDARIEKLCSIIKKIKDKYKIEVCVSPGLLKDEQAKKLKEAGLDRLNHNLNTSSEHYHKICTTHSYAQRLETINRAHTAGLQICSGVIIGMGEGPEGVYNLFKELAAVRAESVPVNFFIPVKGAALGRPEKLTPEYCLRVLCLSRFMLPKTEIRMAAGREFHLRSMQVMGLYAADSLFLQGYLNVKGEQQLETVRMILDAGFKIECDESLDLKKITDFEEQICDPKNLKKECDLHIKS